MERQYIGARYVPKFSEPIEWNNQLTYEALTIVTYMGGSYTSKKVVPVGVKPTNTEYWVMTGNYNAQVEKYRQETVMVAQSLEEVKANWNNRSQRDIIFIGDSYGDNERVENTWCSECATAMGLTADKWHRLCKSGAAFCLEGRRHYIDQLIGYTGNRNTVTDIVLLAGANDWGSERIDILDAARALISYARANYPNAKVHVGYIALSINTPSTQAAYETMETYNSLGYLGYAVIANAISANHNYSRLEDGSFHPDFNANRYIGWSLASYLSGGDYVYNEPTTHELTFESAEGLNLVSCYGVVRSELASASIHTVIQRMVLTIDEPTEWANDSQHTIGKFTSPVFRPSTRVGVTPIQLAYYDGVEYKTTYATMSFSEDGSVVIQSLGKFTPKTLVISGTIFTPMINC